MTHGRAQCLSVGFFVQGVFRARAEATAERVLIAVSDLPVWGSVHFTCAVHDAGVARKDEWAATVGITLRPFGR